MNVGDLRDLIKNVPDDVEILLDVHLEQGRGCSSWGQTHDPDVSVAEVVTVRVPSDVSGKGEVVDLLVRAEEVDESMDVVGDRREVLYFNVAVTELAFQL